MIRTRAVYHIGDNVRPRMRPRIVLFGLMSSLGIAGLWAPSARATDCSGALSPCVNDDTFWPHAGASRFAAVGGTETLAPQKLGFGLVTSYLSRPLVIASRSPGGGSDQYAVNDQVNSTFLWSYGVTSRLEIDFGLPLTIGQGGTGLAPATGGAGLQDTAVRDLRFGAAYALAAHRPGGADPASSSRVGWGLTGRFEISAPTGDRSQFAGERSAVWVPSLAADVRIGRFFAGAEVGVRIRPTTEILGAEVGSQWVSAVGLGADVLGHQWLSITLEGWALATLVGQNSLVRVDSAYANAPNGTPLLPAEWQLSARTAPIHGGDLSIQLGGGGPLPLESSSQFAPRFRFNLGLRWAPVSNKTPNVRSVDADGDGVPDQDDRCPDAPGRGAPDGCPPIGTSEAAVRGLSS